MSSHNNSQAHVDYSHPGTKYNRRPFSAPTNHPNQSIHKGHVYPGPASNVINMQPRTQLSSAFFIPEEMRNDIQHRNEIANIIDTTPNPGMLAKWTSSFHIYILICYSVLDVPDEIDNYHSLYVLDTNSVNPKIPLPSTTYKATNNNTGIKYCLRRLHGILHF